MAELWYYSGRNAAPRLPVALAGLVIATVLYGLFCIPAYSSQSWPPIDRLSEGLTWLWVFPILIFSLFHSGGRVNWIALLVYALVTGAIDAATSPFANMNPHPEFDLFLWVGNIVLTGPIHLAITVVVALTCRIGVRLFGLVPGRRRTCAALVASLIATAAFPSVYQWLTLRHDAMIGSSIADADWAGKSASIYTQQPETYREAGDFEFVGLVDPYTGFPLKQSWQRRYEPGYNAEIRRLVGQYGAPAWSSKNHLVDDADMIGMLTEKNLKEVKSYPCNLSANLVLFRGGGTPPWGGGISNGTNYLDIEARHQDEFVMIPPIGAETDPAFVGQLAKYPGVYFVRCGKDVAACDGGGCLMEVLYFDR